MTGASIRIEGCEYRAPDPRLPTYSQVSFSVVRSGFGAWDGGMARL